MTISFSKMNGHQQDFVKFQFTVKACSAAASPVDKFLY